ncbi:acyltransferase family protein [Aliirhizobium smilacinae]|uniref:Acyltransferase n=1 Tax=Aliirhizobium smilacinae TaxID=1395944 RepID=A0A5C4XPH5_9HYPH|nr:acyltransferase [Rhizobium smilacinae]TNM65313.1 acyltransferase [Rhizobium smilacinae]
MGDRRYRSELDGIRAICILLTITNHISGAPAYLNGTVGVDIFFALSGWLITRLLVDEYDRSGQIYLKGFYIRRAFRIVPLYLVTIMLYGIAAFLVARLKGDPLEFNSYQSALPWLLSFNSEYRSAEAGNLFGHAWTLGIEEKFYILCPAAMSLFVRGWRKIAMLVVPFILLLIFIGDQGVILRGYAGLGFGTVLAIVAGRHGVNRVLQSRWNIYLSIAAITVLYVLSVFFPGGLKWNVAISFVAAFFIAGLWNTRDTYASAALRFSPLVLAGKFTYAIYLTHVLAINAAQIFAGKLGWGSSFWATYIFTYTISVILGAALYYVIELPLIEKGRRLARAWRDKEDQLLELRSQVNSKI